MCYLCSDRLVLPAVAVRGLATSIATSAWECPPLLDPLLVEAESAVSLLPTARGSVQQPMRINRPAPKCPAAALATLEPNGGGGKHAAFGPSAFELVAAATAAVNWYYE